MLLALPILPDGWHATAWEAPTQDVDLAHEALTAKDGDEAERWANEALAHNPADSDAYNALGIAHALRGQWPQAQQAFADAIALTNQYHHYVHYLCSAIHTYRAEWATDAETRAAALKQALFQDHTNTRALALQRGGSSLPAYDLPFWNDEDWPRAIRPPRGQITANAWNSGLHRCRDGAPVRILAKQAIADRSVDMMEEAALLAHQWHQHYHRQASIHRLHHGRVQEALGEFLLARDDYRQAHDIDPGFADPLMRRAALYRREGNLRAAEADELAAAQRA